MSEIKLLPVRSKNDIMKFIKMPWKLYADDKHWVPPLIFEQKDFLNPSKGPFFEYGEAELFIAYKDNEPVGRISAHINKRHDERYGGDKGFFGFFECDDDENTAKALFDGAAHYLKQKGKKTMEGPFSFSIYDEIGILVDGFDSDPYVMNTHNPPYYNDLFVKYGFKKSVDWYAFRGRKGTTDKSLDKMLPNVMKRVLDNPSIAVRQARKNKIEEEAEIIKNIFFDAWSENWGHVNLSEKEWDRIKKALKSMVILPLTYIIEIDGKPAAFALSIYDANHAVKKMNGRLLPFGFINLLNISRTNRFRLLLMGVIKEFRNKGLEIVLYMKVIENALKMGFIESEMSLIVETNEAMINSLGHMEVERYKTYRIYSKDI